MTKEQALVETMLKAIIIEQGPAMFACALNNVCCHGEALIAYGCDLEYYDQQDKVLGKWFEAINQLRKAAKKLEKMAR